MIKISTIILGFTLLILQQGYGQSNGCDGERYKEQIFLNTEATFGITFGSAVTLGGNEESLEMDIYQPVGDDLTNRPVVILAFGGSFIAGSRSDMAPFCADLARRGFVTATIDYRLIDALIFDSIAASEEIIMAASDMKAAIRFLRKDGLNENTYGIDPDLIFVGGVSAGAITACHAAYLREDDDVPGYIQTLLDAHGGIEGESNDETLDVNSEVAGVLNWSGALGRDHWIDWNDAPIYSAHDDMDNIVPCGYDSSDAFFFELFGYGSCSLETRANEVGQYNEFYLVEDSGEHVSYFTDAGQFLSVMDESAAFLEFLVCSYVSVDENQKEEITLYPNPTNGTLNIKGNYAPSNRILVYNSLGAIVLDTNLNTTTIDLSPLNSGVYHLQILNSDSSISIVQETIILR